MISAGNALCGQHLARQGAKAAFHPVADDGIADFLGDSEADARGLVAIGAVADKQDESHHRRALSRVRREKVSAPGKCLQADNL
jgi:hypothetical protein